MSENSGSTILNQLDKKGIVGTKFLFSRSETAAMLNISLASLDRAVKNRQISYRRCGDRPLFAMADIEEFLENQKQPAIARKGR